MSSAKFSERKSQPVDGQSAKNGEVGFELFECVLFDVVVADADDSLKSSSATSISGKSDTFRNVRFGKHHVPV